MRVVVRSSDTLLAPTTKQSVCSCYINLVIRNGRWLAEVPEGGSCDSLLRSAKNLPPETRKNLARHLIGSDPQTLKLIEDLIH